MKTRICGLYNAIVAVCVCVSACVYTSYMLAAVVAFRHGLWGARHPRHGAEVLGLGGRGDIFQKLLLNRKFLCLLSLVRSSEGRFAAIGAYRVMSTEAACGENRFFEM